MLRLDRVTKTFNKGLPNEQVALRGVDVALAEGDYAVIIGSNGAGKSTLLNVIAGDFPPDSGVVHIAGENVTRLPAYRRSRHVSRVFQDPSRGTAPGLTVEENLALALRRGQRRALRLALGAGMRQRFRDALAILGLGLEDRLDARVELLSGGQRQALSLVMAVLVHPALLVLDEHCASLDPRTAEVVMRATIQAIDQSHITTLMVTHNMNHAINHGGRLFMMHEGRFLFEVSGGEKAGLTVETLVRRFRLADDELLLTASL